MKWQSFDRLFTLQGKKRKEMTEDCIKKMFAWDAGLMDKDGERYPHEMRG